MYVTECVTDQIISPRLPTHLDIMHPFVRKPGCPRTSNGKYADTALVGHFKIR